VKLVIMVGSIAISLAPAADFAILGQCSITDWSLNAVSSPYFNIDFEEQRSSFSGVLQWTLPVHRCLDAGIELDVMSLSSLAWRDQDDTHHKTKTRNLSEYGGGLFLAARLNRNCFSSYLKLVPGLYSQHMRFLNGTEGFPPVVGAESTPLHFSMGILAGGEFSLGERWGVRIEGGRYFLRREAFPSYHVQSVNRLDSWKLRMGVFLSTGN